MVEAFVIFTNPKNFQAFLNLFTNASGKKPPLELRPRQNKNQSKILRILTKQAFQRNPCPPDSRRVGGHTHNDLFVLREETMLSRLQSEEALKPVIEKVSLHSFDKNFHSYIVSTV
jgi:hypothetical protein